MVGAGGQRPIMWFLVERPGPSETAFGRGCLKELRWIYDHPSVEEARADLAAWLSKWQ